MTINEKHLRDWEKAQFSMITAKQKRAILGRFGREPEPYEWSEQDITSQIGNYLGCGEIVKTARGEGDRRRLPEGMDF